jgi:hypothetical protein
MSERFTHASRLASLGTLETSKHLNEAVEKLMAARAKWSGRLRKLADGI